MSTPHNATAYPPSSTSSKTPADTAAVVNGRLLNNMFTYGDAYNKIAPQYRVLTGLPEPVGLIAPKPVEGYPEGGTIAEVKEWVAGTPDYEAWQNSVEVGTPTEDEFARTLHAYEHEIFGAGRVTLLAWLEQIPGVDQS